MAELKTQLYDKSRERDFRALYEITRVTLDNNERYERGLSREGNDGLLSDYRDNMTSAMICLYTEDEQARILFVGEEETLVQTAKDVERAIPRLIGLEDITQRV